MRQSAIVERIRQSGNCRLKDIREILPDTSERTLRYDLQSLLEKNLIDFIRVNKYQGLVIDFEMVPVSAYNDFDMFLKELSAQFAPNGWVLAQCAQFDDDAWPYARFAKSIDYTILMAYDQNDESDKAGSIAGESWFESMLDQRMRELPPNHTIVALGSYSTVLFSNTLPQQFYRLQYDY